MNSAHKIDQLLPRLAVCAAVLSRVNRAGLPLVVAAEWRDAFRQFAVRRFDLFGCTSGRAEFPQSGAKIQFPQAQPVALADEGVEIFGRGRSCISGSGPESAASSS